MNKIEYLKYAIDKEYPLAMEWIVDMFSIIVDDIDDSYIKKTDNEFYVKVNNNIVLVDDRYGDKPYMSPTEKIKIYKGFLPIVKEDMETTIGRVIMNYLLLYVPFGEEFKYINEPFNIGYVESEVANRIKEAKEGDAIIDQYLEFANMTGFIKNFANVVSISATVKSVTPPPNIDKIKEEIKQKYIKQYGEKALTDKSIIAQLDKELQQVDIEYLKDDKSFGKLVKGKVIGTHKKMFVSYGLALEFSPKPKGKYIDKSLYEGWPRDPEDIAAMINDSRLGSISRGMETQKGGVVAKYILRMFNNLKIKQIDCGTKLYKPVLLTEDNYSMYKGRYIFANNNTIELTNNNIKEYIGKEIKLRSPMFCKMEDHYCLYCTGSIFKDNENRLPLLMTTVSEAILTESLKKMHNTSIKTKNIEIDDLIT